MKAKELAEILLQNPEFEVEIEFGSSGVKYALMSEMISRYYRNTYLLDPNQGMMFSSDYDR